MTGAERAGVPLEVVAVPQGIAPVEYTKQFTMVRQDQHVVWRGDAAPADTDALFRTLGAPLTA